jgi:O-antigen ligase
MLPPVHLGLAGMAGGDINPNALAAAVLLIFPLGAAVLFLGTGEKIDWLGLMPISLTIVGAGVLTLPICASRSALIAIWLTVVALLVRGMRSWLARIVAGAIVATPLVVGISSPLFLGQEALRTEGSDLWLSAQSRMPIMRQAADRWRESPWMGIGLNEFRSVYQHKGGDVAHAHNMFLQTALDVGAVGSVAYWGILGFLLMRADQAAKGLSRLSRSSAVGSAMALVAISLFGLTDAVPLGSKIGILQWMASGLILASWRTRTAAVQHVPA